MLVVVKVIFLTTLKLKSQRYYGYELDDYFVIKLKKFKKKILIFIKKILIK